MPSRTLRARSAQARSVVAPEGVATATRRLGVAEQGAALATALHEPALQMQAALVARATDWEAEALGAVPRDVAREVQRDVPRDELALVVGSLPRIAPWQESAKRALDVVGAAAGILLALPVLVVLAVLIRMDSRGPALFVQRRVGRHGRAFGCYKLRTMCTDAESRLEVDGTLRRTYERNGYKIPVDCDPRVTRFGRFLRSTSLDELPQLFNVLKGDMSLVGPRPVVERELEHYGAARDVLLSVRPGITGAWAVQGRSSVNYPERADIELAYARSWTVAEDLRILVRTVGVVLQQHGAH
ncbi:sugar transferase [Roseisolibacter sp. H3M3-2]|uniref:sugar transferase n=1 Tax=Roseisolibacter sp. H3M3-2 TaxID=3031323 RepID=UPI0023DCC6E5|nr:sugar transferase [Roseisolibacter sp. H3M3-2]MDF1502335.1 sugar transferase [Roseisolibacter sp. H3M3-2]